MGIAGRSALVVVMRADASTTIGSGHVMRCLSLAGEMRRRSARVIFVMQDIDGHLADRVRAAGHDVTLLQVPGVWAEERDAAATVTALEAMQASPDWVVTDHYALGSAWEAAVRQCGASIMAIDDLANRSHDCEVLLDQNLVADMDRRYDGMIGKATLRLLGPRYALLRPEYRAARRKLSRGKIPRRILVYFGGADAMLTTMGVEAFIRVQAKATHLDVVLDTKNPQHEVVRSLCEGVENITLQAQLPDLAVAMAQADLCLGASGTTAWERLCLGLPSIVVTMADNQLPIAAELARRGLATWIGDSATMTVDVMTAALSRALADGVSAEGVAAMMEAVDGWGTERVCDALILPPAALLVMRDVRAEDSAMLLVWANDPGTRQYAFRPQSIQADEHSAWFARRLGNPDVAFYVAETPFGLAAGQVRFERRADDAWEISYLLAPLFRGRGLGQGLLEAALHHFGRSHPGALAVGRVQADNTASIRIFRALGFGESADGVSGALEFQRPVGA